MKKHLLLASAVIACAFSSSAFAAGSATISGEKWVQGVSSDGRNVWFGPGYKAATPETMGQRIWNSAVGKPNSPNAVQYKPTQAPTVRPMAVGKGLVVASKIAVPIAGMLAVINVDNSVTNAALIGAVTGLVTGGPGNAVFMGSASALMAWATSADGISQNPSFPDSQTTHPFLKASDEVQKYCKPSNQFIADWRGWVAGRNLSPNPDVTNTMTETSKVVGEMCEYGGNYSIRNNLSGDVYTGYEMYSQIPKETFPSTGSKPATWAEVAPEVDASGNILPETLEEALDYGAHPDMTTTVSGPATGEGATTTTTNNTTGAVTTNTTTNNYTYNNNNVSWNTTSKNETTNPDGTTDTDITVKEPGKDEKPEEPDTPPTDTPLGPVPDLYERKYPDGMEGVWNTYKDQLKNTSLGSLASKLMPNIPDGGTCPQWPINLDMAQWAAFGTHDVAPPCYIWGIAKAILVVSALLLARALIFGG